MARNKRYNRKSEFAYQNEEMYALLDSRLNGAEYPEEALREGWETILRNQFHDILPGSSIREVYEDSKEEYEKILGESRKVTGGSLKHLAASVNAPARSLVVFNPNSAAACDVVTFACPDGLARPAVYDGGQELPVQKAADGSWMFTASGVPGKGYKTFRLAEASRKDPETMTVSDKVMENVYFLLTFDENGQFDRIYDKRAGREVLKPGQKGNVLVSYEDRPHNFDAWDVNHYYTEKSWEISSLDALEVVENGPVRGTVKLVRHYLDSEIVQYISIYRDIPRIDIRNEIDWKEHLIFLKDYFPVDVHTDEATFDIQYGNVKRPTHENTSWDMAKFEVCHHKWLDVSEDGYGVSVLNDCKYGASVRDGVIGLSMLKSALYPNRRRTRSITPLPTPSIPTARAGERQAP